MNEATRAIIIEVETDLLALFRELRLEEDELSPTTEALHDLFLRLHSITTDTKVGA
jgi:hypothetical protein